MTGADFCCAGLAADELLQVCRVTVTHNLNLGECVRYFVQIVGGKLYGSRPNVLFEPMQLRRSRNRDDPGLLGEQHASAI
jgi:hypothetical protein